MSGWCDWLGHHFTAPFWPFGEVRCLHCGISEADAMEERRARIDRIRAETECIKAEAAEAKARTDAVLARNREVMDRVGASSFYHGDPGDETSGA